MRARRTAPARVPRAARLAPADRRAQLVACAIRVFARRGLGAARHTEVAAEAAVSVPTVFFYFPTREALVDAVLDEVSTFFLAMGRRHLAVDAPAPDRLMAFAQAFAASVESHPDHARVWLDWSTAVRDDLWPRYLRFQNQIAAALARTIRHGQRDGSVAPDLDPADEARLFVSAAYVVTQMTFAHQGPQRVTRFLRTLVRATTGHRPGR